MALRSRFAGLLAKVENTPGTDASPSGTDAVKVHGRIKMKPAVAIEYPDESQGSLDSSGPIAEGTLVDTTFDVWPKGSGVAGTAAEWGKLVKACGMSETLTGSAVGAPTAASAGGASSLTLATPAGTTAQQYRGMPILLTTNPASGLSYISNYTAGRVATLTDIYSPALDNTTEFQIPKNVLYKPISSSIPALSMYWYQDGRLFKMFGARGNLRVKLDAAKGMMFNFSFRGIFGGVSDAAVPTLTYDSDALARPIWRNVGGIDGAALIDGDVMKCASLSIDLGNQLAFPENPNATEGVDAPEIIGRRITGAVDPLATLVATRDPLTDLRAGTRRVIHARLGTTAGNRFGIVIPAAQYTDFDPGDRNGLAADGLPFMATGADSGFFLCMA